MLQIHTTLNVEESVEFRSCKKNPVTVYGHSSILWLRYSMLTRTSMVKLCWNGGPIFGDVKFGDTPAANTVGAVASNAFIPAADAAAARNTARESEDMTSRGCHGLHKPHGIKLGRWDFIGLAPADAAAEHAHHGRRESVLQGYGASRQGRGTCRASRCCLLLQASWADERARRSRDGLYKVASMQCSQLTVR